MVANLEEKHWQEVHVPWRLKPVRSTRSKLGRSLYIALALLTLAMLLHLRVVCNISDFQTSQHAIMTRFTSWVVGILLPLQLAYTSSAIDYTPMQPPSYPLAVRNPYLSGQNTIFAIT
jgi:hypothetical protein